MLSWDHIWPALKHWDKTFKIILSKIKHKNVNFGDKKWQASVKKTQTFLKSHKKSLTCKRKSHKLVKKCPKLE